MSKKLTPSNDIIALINDLYGPQLKQIISNALLYSANVPVEVEDIYWSFMYTVPKIVASLSPLNTERMKVIIFTECKFYAKNSCRKWQTKNHSILNNAFELQDSVQYFENQNIFELGVKSTDEDADWQVDKEQLLMHLSRSDRSTYRLYFIENHSYRDIAKMKHWTVHKVACSVERIIGIAKKFLSK